MDGMRLAVPSLIDSPQPRAPTLAVLMLSIVSPRVLCGERAKSGQVYAVRLAHAAGRLDNMRVGEYLIREPPSET